MKKLMVFGLNLIFLVLFLYSVSAIRINEVELNPNDTCGDCTEWLELYSEQGIKLEGWKIMDASNKTLNLTGSINGYYILENFTLSLNNNDEKLFLYNGTILVQETLVLSDSFNDNRSWQYCNGNWTFLNSTKGLGNICTFQNNTQQNPLQNQSQQNNTNNNQEASIYLKLDWDEDDIVNGEDFKIAVKAYNLKNENYDIKIYIKPEDEETLISEVYDEKNEKWKSGNYYVNEIFKGSGDISENFKLRIKASYRNFSGDAEIVAKIRKSGSSSIIDEVKEDIEVLEKENKEENNKTIETKKDNRISKTTEENDKTEKITGEIIKLGNRQAEIEVEGEKVLYESKSEKIKKYAIYGLNLILIIIVIFLIINLRKK